MQPPWITHTTFKVNPISSQKMSGVCVCVCVQAGGGGESGWAAGRIKSNRTRPESVQEGSDSRRMGKRRAAHRLCNIAEGKGEARKGFGLHAWWGVLLCFAPLFLPLLLLLRVSISLSLSLSLSHNPKRMTLSSRAGEIISFTLAKRGRDQIPKAF